MVPSKIRNWTKPLQFGPIFGICSRNLEHSTVMAPPMKVYNTSLPLSALQRLDRCLNAQSSNLYRAVPTHDTHSGTPARKRTTTKLISTACLRNNNLGVFTKCATKCAACFDYVIFFQACFKTCYQRHMIERCGCGDAYYPMNGTALGNSNNVACRTTNITQGETIG